MAVDSLHKMMRTASGLRLYYRVTAASILTHSILVGIPDIGSGCVQTAPKEKYPDTGGFTAVCIIADKNIPAKF